MGQAQFFFKPVVAPEMLHNFAGAMAEAFAGTPVESLMVGTNLIPNSHYSFSVANAADLSKAPGMVKAEEQLTERIDHIIIQTISATTAHPHNPNQRFTDAFACSDDVLAQITISCPDDNLFRGRIAGVVDAFRKHFNFTRRGQILGANLSEVERVV